MIHAHNSDNGLLSAWSMAIKDPKRHRARPSGWWDITCFVIDGSGAVPPFPSKTTNNTQQNTTQPCRAPVPTVIHLEPTSNCLRVSKLKGLRTVPQSDTIEAGHQAEPPPSIVDVRARGCQPENQPSDWSVGVECGEGDTRTMLCTNVKHRAMTTRVR
jgi:hypothetical protein